MKQRIFLLALLAITNIAFAQDPGFNVRRSFYDAPFLKGKEVTYILEFGNMGTGTIVYNSAGPVKFTISIMRVTNASVAESNTDVNGSLGTPGNLAAYFDITPLVTNAGATNETTTFTFTQKKDIPADSVTQVTFTGTVVADVNQNIVINGNVTPGGTIGNGNTTGNDIFDASQLITGVLPVIFKSYDAKIVGDKLVVNWVTASEKDNSYFDVEVLDTDSVFRSAGRVTSKAQNGNSDAPLEYKFEKNLSTGAQAFMGVALFAAGFILLLFNRKNKWLYTLLIVCGLGTSAISCRKQSEDRENRLPDRQMVRVVQVDKEGAKIVSKIAVAVRQ